jgi:hypothetical protein
MAVYGQHFVYVARIIQNFATRIKNADGQVFARYDGTRDLLAQLNFFHYLASVPGTRKIASTA